LVGSGTPYIIVMDLLDSSLCNGKASFVNYVWNSRTFA
jgi:hypothetical protein